MTTSGSALANMPTPLALMEHAVARLGSPAAVARDLGITAWHLTRLRQGTARYGAELSVRLADLLGEDRAFVLRVCGHASLAALIYSSGHPERSRVQEAIDPPTTKDRRLIQTLIDRLLFLLAKPPATVRDDEPKGGAR